MSNVLQFKPREDPHATGDAFCIDCKHKWGAVAPVGTTQLECPECGTKKGRFEYPFAPAVGDAVWTCHCGSDIFYILGADKGCLCANCGLLQSF